MDSANPESLSQSQSKVLIFLRAISAPTLKRQKFKLDGTKSLIEVERFLKKSLSLQDKSVFLYCGSGFSPVICFLFNHEYFE